MGPTRSADLSRGSFGAAVCELRERRGISQDALAAATDLRPTLVDAIETGRLAVGLPTILSLAVALEVSAADILRLAESIGAGDS